MGDTDSGKSNFLSEMQLIADQYLGRLCHAHGQWVIFLLQEIPNNLLKLETATFFTFSVPFRKKHLGWIQCCFAEPASSRERDLSEWP